MLSILSLDLSIERWAANGKHFTSKCCPYWSYSGAVLNCSSGDKKSLHAGFATSSGPYTKITLDLETTTTKIYGGDYPNVCSKYSFVLEEATLDVADWLCTSYI